MTKGMIAGSNLHNFTIPQLIGIYDIQLYICIISISVAVSWFAIANFLTQRLIERNAYGFPNSDNQSDIRVVGLAALKKPLLISIFREDELPVILLLIISSYALGVATTYHDFDVIHKNLAVKSFDYSSLGNFQFIWQFFTTPKVWAIALAKGTLCAFAGALVALLVKLIFQKSSDNVWINGWIVAAFLVFYKLLE